MNFRKKTTGKDIVGFLLLAVSMLLLGKSFALCFCNDIWYDELFTVGMADHSYGELIRFTAADVHPPLYYCIVKFFVDLCKLIMPGAGTVVPAKLVSVLPYFGLFLYSICLIRKRFGLFVGGMFLFCVIAMPQLPAYTVEMRMYGWAMLFVTAAFLHGYETVAAGLESGESGENRKKGRRLHAAAFVLYGLAAAYTQYFAAVAVVTLYFCVLLVLIKKERGRIKEWFLWVGVSAAAYLPWLLVLYRQITAVRANYWILPLTWRSLGGCVKFLMKPAFSDDKLNTALAVILFISYVAVWGYHAVKLCHYRREKERNWENSVKTDRNNVYEETERFWLATAGVAALGGIVLFGFAASILIRPIFVYRYMLSAAGCFWFSFALGLDGIWTGKNRIAYGLGAALTLLVCLVGLRNYRAFMGEEEYKAVNMKETAQAVSRIGPQDKVIYNFDQVQAVTAYYLPKTVERFLWQAEGEKLVQEIFSPCGSIEDVDEIGELLKAVGDEGGKLWFIGSFNSREDIVSMWRDAGFDVEEEGSFLLERYWFNLYRIS